MDDEQLQGGGYNVDIVMCIDGTASMRPIINEVKNNALTFYQKFVNTMEENEKMVEELRLKVIVFRDYGCDAEPMVQSEFFKLSGDSNEGERFKAFVDGIEAKGGGDLPENSLEALALALKSDWTTGGIKRRHAILMFTDAAALPLGERAGSAGYPEGMPHDLAELGAWWEGTDQTMGGTYQFKSGRLVVFAPNAYPWTDIQAWNRNWTSFSAAGSGLSELDIQSAIDVLVGSI